MKPTQYITDKFLWKVVGNVNTIRAQTYRLHEGDVVDEVPLGHVQGEFAIGRALFEHFKVVHHLEGTAVFHLRKLDGFFTSLRRAGKDQLR